MENNGQGPTKILPFLYLGSQKDAFNKKHLIVSNLKSFLKLFEITFFFLE